MPFTTRIQFSGSRGSQTYRLRCFWGLITIIKWMGAKNNGTGSRPVTTYTGVGVTTLLPRKLRKRLYEHLALVYAENMRAYLRQNHTRPKICR